MTASWRDEQAGKGEWFGYNATGQLTDVKYNADGVSSGNPRNATRTVNYAISSNTLNRESMNDNGDVSAYAPNALNQYQNVAGGEMDYDGNFNLIWSGGFSASYDAMNRLTWAQSSEDAAQFVYDGLGRCLKRTVSWETILITYDGWKPIMEWDEWGYFKAWNLYGPGADEILWRYSNSSGHLRYHLDRMGNVAFLLDLNGAVVEKYTYDAFGRPTVTDADGANPRSWSWYGNRFLFTGREWIPELGIYDYRHRFYHPILGRFLQKDPTKFAAGDANLFRYCGGDPVNFTDPSGLVTPESKKQKEWGDNNYGIGGSASGPFSTQGFWSGPSGLPTNIPSTGSTGGASGPDNTNQGGGRGGYATTFSNARLNNGLLTFNTQSTGWLGNSPLGFGENFGFQPGQISMGPPLGVPRGADSWNQFYNWLKYRPVSAETAAWTDKGRVPTLIAAAVIFAPLAVPEAAAPVLVAGANVISTGANASAAWVAHQILINPQWVVRAGALLEGFNEWQRPVQNSAHQWWEAGGQVFGFANDYHEVTGEWPP